jgi:hypothetical protein
MISVLTLCDVCGAGLAQGIDKEDIFVQCVQVATSELPEDARLRGLLKRYAVLPQRARGPKALRAGEVAVDGHCPESARERAPEASRGRRDCTPPSRVHNPTSFPPFPAPAHTLLARPSARPPRPPCCSCRCANRMGRIDTWMATTDGRLFGLDQDSAELKKGPRAVLSPYCSWRFAVCPAVLLTCFVRMRALLQATSTPSSPSGPSRSGSRVPSDGAPDSGLCRN